VTTEMWKCGNWMKLYPWYV